VPLDEGPLRPDDYIDYLIGFLEHIGKTDSPAHMLAVCQPSVPAYAATAVMGAAKTLAPADADHDGRPGGHARGAHQRE
jgi:poly-beta-hydroxyalkanoate depolymerase